MNRIIIIAITSATAFLALWLQRQRRPRKEIAAIGSDIRPTRVILPDEEVKEDVTKHGPSGEEQELERNVMHGPYRRIVDRGAPSRVYREG